MDAFKPGIDQENKGNKAENYPGHYTGFNPELAVPGKEKQGNKPQRSEDRQNGINHDIAHDPQRLCL